MSRRKGSKGHPKVPNGIENEEIYLAALEVLSASNEFNPKSTSETVNEIAGKIGHEGPVYPVYHELIRATKVDGSCIGSRKGRNGGYFLRSDLESSEKSLEQDRQTQSEKTLEKHLWPIAAEWLRVSKNVSRVSSVVANLKGGGIWSNPDVVGINVFEELGFFDVEITTLEVKPSLKGWKYFFFEAVSHKRFSERVYFVFRSNGDTDSEVRLEMLKYAEKFGVGVVEMQLDQDSDNDLKNWAKLNDEKKVELIDSFLEIVPASFEAISARDKIAFLRQIGIESREQLYGYGTY